MQFPDAIRFGRIRQDGCVRPSRRGAARLLPGSVAESVPRNAPCSVLVAPQARTAADAPEGTAAPGEVPIAGGPAAR